MSDSIPEMNHKDLDWNRMMGLKQEIERKKKHKALMKEIVLLGYCPYCETETIAENYDADPVYYYCKSCERTLFREAITSSTFGL
jgi:predicted SprT family Zn-dependent metalloprotease